jgi:hypothetical protein
MRIEDYGFRIGRTEDGYQMLAPPPTWKTAGQIEKETLKKRILNKDELK